MSTMKMVLVIDQKGGLSLKIEDSETNEHVVRSTVVLIPDTTSHMVGSPSKFRIQPYNFTDTYDFQAVLGNCYAENGMLYYVGLLSGTETITLNGATVTSFQVTDPAPGTPAMVFPAENAINQPVNAVVSCSPYVPPEGQNYVHTATRWQLASDENFTNIVRDFTSATDLTSTVVAGLTYSTSYWVRCMHIAELN